MSYQTEPNPSISTITLFHLTPTTLEHPRLTFIILEYCWLPMTYHDSKITQWGWNGFQLEPTFRLCWIPISTNYLPIEIILVISTERNITDWLVWSLIFATSFLSLPRSCQRGCPLTCYNSVSSVSSIANSPFYILTELLEVTRSRTQKKTCWQLKANILIFGKIPSWGSCNPSWE